jgi:hypothetical protein
MWHEYIPQVVQNVKSSHNNNIPHITILTNGISAFQNFQIFLPYISQMCHVA